MKKEIIATNSIIDATESINPVEIGEITISQMIYYPDSVWIANKEGEGGQFRKELLEPVLKEFFNKHF